MTDEQKAYYRQIHQEIADRHSTTPDIINYIRSRAGNGQSLQVIKDAVEEKLQTLQQTIESQRKALLERSDAGKNEKRQEQIDFALKKKSMLLSCYTLLHRLNDSKFSDITQPVKKYEVV